MPAVRRFLLVALLAGLPALALGGDDPKGEEAKKQEAEKKAADEKAKREADEKAAAVKAAKAAQEQAAAQAVLQAQVARQQLVFQQRGIPIQPGGFGGPGMGGAYYFAPAVESASDTHLKLGPGEVEVRFGDDSIMRVVLLADVLDLETAYGKLTIPLSDVKRVDFGLRITPEEERVIAAAIADAGGPDPKKRVAARDILVGLREKALPAVRRAAAAAAGTEAGTFLADGEGRIRSALPDGLSSPSDRDKVVTGGSTFVGRLTTTEFKVRTYAFGEQPLKLATVRSLRTRTADEADDGPVTPWTGSMAPFASQQGKTFRVRVTGQAGGGLWGTGTYTMDSYLPAAAIHAGALKPGETGVVKFKIVPSPQAYQGSTQNGVTSGNYPFYQGGAYEILK